MGSYAITTPAGIVTHPHVQVFLEVPVLVNPQPLPPDKASFSSAASNVSLMILLSGSSDALNGTIVINRNQNILVPNAAPERTTLEACRAVARGKIVARNSTDTASNSSDNILVVVTALVPPDPCTAGLQGYKLVVQWQVFTGNVRLTAIPQIPTSTSPAPTSTAEQVTLKWAGQSAAGSEISVVLQSSSATPIEPT